LAFAGLAIACKTVATPVNNQLPRPSSTDSSADVDFVPLDSLSLNADSVVVRNDTAFFGYDSLLVTNDSIILAGDSLAMDSTYRARRGLGEV